MKKMKRRSGARGFWLSCLAGVIAASCGDDIAGGERRGPGDGGFELFDAAGSDVGTSCPLEAPKIGELCDESFETVTCNFLIGECTTASGVSYDDFVTYCCFLGVWQTCTGPSLCDQLDGSTAVGSDAMSSAPDRITIDTPSTSPIDSKAQENPLDAGLDAGSDASPNGGADGGSDVADAGV